MKIYNKIFVDEALNQLQNNRDWVLKCQRETDNIERADLRRIELIMNKAIRQCHETLQTGKLPEGIL